MIKLLSFMAIAISVFFVVSAPYIAALFYTTVSILQPQYVWFWAFDGISIFKISAGIAIVAWGIQMLRGGLNWQVYNNGIFYGLLILCALYYISDTLSPFQSYSASVSSNLVIDIYTTIVIMFFIILGLINHDKALKYLVWVIIAVTLYYTYWANMNYLEGNWSQFTQNRLKGPARSPYRDGNVFSVLFVVGLPFIVLAIYQVEKKWQQVLFILAIPFVWHAMVLCASRGALLSAVVSTLVAAWMMKSKTFNLALVAGFLIFIVHQGGQILERSVVTAQQAKVETEQPLNPRLVSWGLAVDIAKKHPILGVGPERFLHASRIYYPGKSPHVAHSTLLNYAANLGLVAAFIYISFFWISWKMYKWNKLTLEKHPDRLHSYVNNASLCSLAGFFVGATFLDLIIFEPFFFLLLIIIANNFLLKQKVAKLSVAEYELVNGRPTLRAKHMKVRNNRV